MRNAFSKFKKCSNPFESGANIPDRGLGVGATSLLKNLTDPSLPVDQQVDVSKPPRQLSVNDWKLIVNAFERWPFRPENLSIDNGLLPYGKDGRK